MITIVGIITLGAALAWAGAAVTDRGGSENEAVGVLIVCAGLAMMAFGPAAFA